MFILSPDFFSPQLCDRPVWAPVFIAGRTSRAHHSAGSPPRQKHYGISAVALGYPVLNEHQHSQGHQEQPLHLRNAGLRPAFEFNLPASQDTCKLRVACQRLCVKKNLNFFSFLLPLQLGIPHTFVMMSYQYKFQDDDQTKIKGSVKYGILKFCPVNFQVIFFFCMYSNSSLSVLQIRFFWDCDRVRCREEDQSTQRPWGHR